MAESRLVLERGDRLTVALPSLGRTVTVDFGVDEPKNMTVTVRADGSPFTGIVYLQPIPDGRSGDAQAT
jgi:hypothetical protein